MKTLKEIITYLINPRPRLKIEPEDGEMIVAPKTLTWKQVFSYPPLVIGLVLTIGLIIIIWFAPQWSSYDPYLITQSARPYYDAQIKKIIKPPFPVSAQYPLGTDHWGNDLLSLVLYGARVTLIAGLYITLSRIAFGTFLGALAGWYENSFIDRSIDWLGTTMSSVPILLSSIILIYALDIHNGLWVFVVALSLLGWSETAQLVRGEVMRVRREEYVEAAEAVGMNNIQIVVRHIIPNVLPYLIVITALEMGAVLLLLAELAYLGVFIGGGARYNDDPFSPRVVLLREIPEWGAMVAQGIAYLRSYPNMVLVPGMAFFISIVAVNSLGEGLRWLFTRWPFSTAILLKKRSFVVLGSIVLVSVVVLNQTGPQASFAKVSSEITADKVQARVDAMLAIRTAHPGDAAAQIAEYIATEMQDMGAVFGWRSGLHPAFQYDYETVVNVTATDPVLARLSDTGEPVQAYLPMKDFVLAPDQKMTDTSLQAGITLVNTKTEVDAIPVAGRVVMALASQAPVNYSQFVSSQGALGLLLVDDSSSLPCNVYANMPVVVKYLAMVQRGDIFIAPRPTLLEGEPQPLPTLLITPETATGLLEGDDLTLDVFSQDDWVTRDLSTNIYLNLQFNRLEQVSVANAIGYIGGYDIDNAHETIILFAPYDSTTGSADDLLSPALMLEMLKAWSDNHLDPRRSVLFVAWDRSHLGSPGSQAFMDEIDNFRLLTPKVPAAQVEPIMVWDLSMPGAFDGAMQVTASSDAKLRELLQKSGRNFGASMEVVPSGACQPDPSMLLPSVTLLPGETGSPSFSFIEEFGRSVSLSVLEILRLPKY